MIAPCPPAAGPLPRPPANAPTPLPLPCTCPSHPSQHTYPTIQVRSIAHLGLRLRDHLVAYANVTHTPVSPGATSRLAVTFPQLLSLELTGKVQVRKDALAALLLGWEGGEEGAGAGSNDDSHSSSEGGGGGGLGWSQEDFPPLSAATPAGAGAGAVGPPPAALAPLGDLGKDAPSSSPSAFPSTAVTAAGPNTLWGTPDTGTTSSSAQEGARQQHPCLAAVPGAAPWSRVTLAHQLRILSLDVSLQVSAEDLGTCLAACGRLQALTVRHRGMGKVQLQLAGLPPSLQHLSCKKVYLVLGPGARGAAAGSPRPSSSSSLTRSTSAGGAGDTQGSSMAAPAAAAGGAGGSSSSSSRRHSSSSSGSRSVTLSVAIPDAGISSSQAVAPEGAAGAGGSSAAAPRPPLATRVRPAAAAATRGAVAAPSSSAAGGAAHGLPAAAAAAGDGLRSKQVALSTPASPEPLEGLVPPPALAHTSPGPCGLAAGPAVPSSMGTCSSSSSSGSLAAFLLPPDVKLPALHTLVLKSCLVGEGLPCAVATTSGHQLTQLCLTGDTALTEVWNAWLPQLPRLPGLQVVEVWVPECYAGHPQQLAHQLGQLPRLTHLHVSASGSPALIQGLSSLTTLRTLAVEYTGPPKLPRHLVEALAAALPCGKVQVWEGHTLKPGSTAGGDRQQQGPPVWRRAVGAVLAAAGLTAVSAGVGVGVHALVAGLLRRLGGRGR
jgi:hypothetical protein